MQSAQDWKGLQPNRFSGGRFHIRPQDQLRVDQGIEGPSQPPIGRKHYEQGVTKQAAPRSSIRPSKLTYLTTNEEIPDKHRKMINFKASSKPPRP